MVGKEFLKEVLAERKALLKMHQVKFINVPKFDEVSVTKLYAKALAQDGMAQYFPSKYAKGKNCSREYFFQIWNTKYPDQVAKVI